LLLRLWYFQVVKASDLTDKAESNNSDTTDRQAPRGMIFDRNGVLLAGVHSEFVLMATPKTIRQNDWVFDKLGTMLNTDPKKLRTRFNQEAFRPYVKVPIVTGVPVDLATRIAESKDNLPGIDVDSQPIRYYPDTTNFAHVLGYVWTP